jgi:hypothetical protein
MNFHPNSAFLLLPAMVLLLEAGRHLRRRRGEAIVSGAIEGAIFGHFGLLLAFTFSGAISRFDTHRHLLTREVSDPSTAYLRLDLLPPQAQRSCSSFHGGGLIRLRGLDQTLLSLRDSMK